jgi:hypothetical protein
MAHDKTTVRRIIDKVKAEGRTSLTAPEGKLVCDSYGIAVPQEGVAKSPAEAAKLAGEMGFPVVLKIVSPEILHKTEAGGVLVGLENSEAVQRGYETIVVNARRHNAKASIHGVQVQQMLRGGQEVIIGAVTDPSFGKLVAFGSYFFAFEMIVSKPARTSASFFTPTSTPPASVLCRISGDTIFSTTGKPMNDASFAASSADFATPSCGTAMPYASQTSLPSGAVSEVRPSAYTRSNTSATRRFASGACSGTTRAACVDELAA